MISLPLSIIIPNIQSEYFITLPLKIKFSKQIFYPFGSFVSFMYPSKSFSERFGGKYSSFPVKYWLYYLSRLFISFLLAIQMHKYNNKSKIIFTTKRHQRFFYRIRRQLFNFRSIYKANFILCIQNYHIYRANILLF